MYTSMYLGLSEVEANLREAKADGMTGLFGDISEGFGKLFG